MPKLKPKPIRGWVIVAPYEEIVAGWWTRKGAWKSFSHAMRPETSYDRWRKNMRKRGYRAVRARVEE